MFEMSGHFRNFEKNQAISANSTNLEAIFANFPIGCVWGLWPPTMTNL